MSSLCTAVVFWAILKWDTHADEPGADRWLVFIAYIIGLSIGIHLLNLLTIPALAVVYYFRRAKTHYCRPGNRCSLHRHPDPGFCTVFCAGLYH